MVFIALNIRLGKGQKGHMHDSTSYIGVGLGSELDPLELRHISFVSCYETHSNPN
jgi:hypothetical protein